MFENPYSQNLQDQIGQLSKLLGGQAVAATADTMTNANRLDYVDGIDGARAFLQKMLASTKHIVWDNQKPVFYVLQKDAKGYAEHALRYKDDYPQQARTLDQLSKEELDHMAKLHKEVGALIEDYRREHGDPPPAMQARYDYLHERFIKWASEVRVLQAMFRDA